MDAGERTMHALLGTYIHVEVDRPIGCRHGDIVYPINCGCIPGVIAGDGKEQDAYILGVSEPVFSFDGRVVGAIRRKNHWEDKLVVAPDGMVFHQGEIAGAVLFQEQYFESTIDSLFRKSCGVIPYRKVGDEREFLILLQTNHCWSFPKGHMEAEETETQTALRELFEETGMQATLVSDARITVEYRTCPLTRKQVVLFLGEVHGNVIPQEKEIVNYRWVKADALQDYLQPDTYEACAKVICANK